MFKLGINAEGAVKFANTHQVSLLSVVQGTGTSISKTNESNRLVYAKGLSRRLGFNAIPTQP
jgi:hypothetical protein